MGQSLPSLTHLWVWNSNPIITWNHPVLKNWITIDQTIKTSTEINAHTQLVAIFQELKTQLEKKEAENKASEQENLNLESKLDSAKMKIKQARLDLMDSINYLRELRRYAKLNKWEDEELIKTLDEFEEQITKIGSYLTLTTD